VSLFFFEFTASQFSLLDSHCQSLDVFVAFHSPEASYVIGAFEHALLESKLTFVLDTKIPTASSEARALSASTRQQLLACRCFVCFISPSFFASGYPLAQLLFLQQHRNKGDLRIVTVSVDMLADSILGTFHANKSNFSEDCASYGEMELALAGLTKVIECKSKEITSPLFMTKLVAAVNRNLQGMMLIL
jgi:hypothetical protein